MRYIVGYISFLALSVLLGLLAGFIHFTSITAKLCIFTSAVVSLYIIYKYKDLKFEFSFKSFKFWDWFVVISYTLFILKSFVWLIFPKENGYYITAPNNLGDLSSHIQFINYLAQFPKFWPDNPIITGFKLRYTFGMDFMNSLLILCGCDLIKSILWLAFLSTFSIGLLFLNWGRSFALAGFLFNGGLAGFAFFKTFIFEDYQSKIAWKSIPLTMLITQRGLLYALPAGLILLYYWRKKYFSQDTKNVLPFWIELLLYAAMPIFHFHTFIFLSLLLFSWILILPKDNKIKIAKFLLAAFIPASLQIFFMTEFFKSSSIIHIRWNWMAFETDMNFVLFWLFNFGILIPLVIIYIMSLISEKREGVTYFKFKINESLAFVLPSIVLFILFSHVMLSVWEWDNAKLLMWSYFIILPFLWNELIAKWPKYVKTTVCFLLFFSGFICVIGGVDPRKSYKVINLSEIRTVNNIVKNIPIDAVFATYPHHNVPVLFCGKKLVLGYQGWVWSHGIKYDDVEKKLNALMLGEDSWKKQIKDLNVSYIFWGRLEIENYKNSKRPWEKELKPIASGIWGQLYDVREILKS